MFKKERGITLIALVVTIVVILILAGVSISLVISNNGIVKRAKQAKTNQQAAYDAEAHLVNNTIPSEIESALQ